jgi:O-antigen ligase
MHTATFAGPPFAKRLDLAAARRVPRHILYHLFSFEAVFALYIFAGRVKGNPTFSWLFPIDATLLSFVASVGIGLFIIWRNGLYRPGLTGVLLLLPFLAWAAASLFWSPSRFDAFQRVRDLLILNLWAFAGAALVVASRRIRVYRLVMFVVLFGLALSIDWVTLTGSFTHRGFLEDREYAGTARVVANAAIICFVAVLSLKKGSLGWIVYLLLLGFFVYTLLIIGVRSPLLAMVLLMIGIPLATGLRFGQRSVLVTHSFTWALLFSLAGGALLGYLFLSGQISWTLERMLSLANMVAGDSVDASAGERIKYLVAALGFWSESPISVLVGRGIGSFPVLYLGREWNSSFPHNIPVEVLMEMGLVGLALFSLPFVYCIRRITLERLTWEPLFLIAVMMFGAGVFYAVTSGSLISLFQVTPYMALLLVRPPEEEWASFGEFEGMEEGPPPELAAEVSGRRG